MTLHCAFIGFGRNTTHYHLPCVLNRKNSWHVAYISHRNARSEEQASQYSHIHSTNDLDEILNDPQVKLVITCTHADSHFKYAKRALEASKNVLVGKPFTPTLAQVKELFELAQGRGLTVTPYQNRRFDPCFLTTKKTVESGKFGKIVEVESRFGCCRPEVETKSGLPQDDTFRGLGVRTMSQIISLFGHPDHVTYDICSLHNKASPDDTSEARLLYGNLKATVKTSYLMKINYPEFIVHGTKGLLVKYGIDRQRTSLKTNIVPSEPGFVADDSIGMLEYVNDDGITVKKEMKPKVGDYGHVYDSLYQTLTAGMPSYVKESEALANLEILEHAFEQVTLATITLAKQPVRTPLVLFISLERRSQFSSSMTPDGLSSHLFHRKRLGANTMIYLRKTSDRGRANHGWLDSWCTFSFTSYYDPNFTGFSALHVINDGVIDVGQGFDTHLHKDMEVLTYVLEGTVEYQNSMNNREQVSADEFQTISAGTEVRCSGYSPSNTEKLHLYQIWIMPQENGTTPRYEQRRFGAAQGKQLVLSPDTRDGSLKMCQDMELYRWVLVRDEQSVHQIVAGRRVWIQVVESSVTISGTKATTSDGLAIWDE